tara:strand:+ start:12372 stop:12836 length:465 start_codon:yes stop_codon:yes gene_type:complete
MNSFKQTSLAIAALICGIFVSNLVFAANKTVTNDCIPEASIESPVGISMPVFVTKEMPLPTTLALLTVTSTMPDEYDPYKSIMVEFVTEGNRESVFSFYEKSLAAAGYRIVQWEKDINMGLRFKGDGFEEGSLSISDYDCRPLVNINLIFLPDL